MRLWNKTLPLEPSLECFMPLLNLSHREGSESVKSSENATIDPKKSSICLQFLYFLSDCFLSITVFSSAENRWEMTRTRQKCAFRGKVRSKMQFFALLHVIRLYISLPRFERIKVTRKSWFKSSLGLRYQEFRSAWCCRHRSVSWA